MYLKFVGENGSMGLRAGQIYDVKVRSNGSCILVYVGFKLKCKYSSPITFAANWEKP